MIKIQGKLPRRIYLACSGGVDSMAALDFLRRNHEVEVLHFNHGTAHGEQAQNFVENYTHKINVPLHVGVCVTTMPKGESKEKWWREQRYRFLDCYDDAPVITCHHLDDCVETWIWSSMHGSPSIIPYQRHNTIRPFRLNRKREFTLWCNLQGVPYIEDDSNKDMCYTRNYIRHEMMPHALRINPGIHKMVKKKVLSADITNIKILGIKND